MFLSHCSTEKININVARYLPASRFLRKKHTLSTLNKHDKYLNDAREKRTGKPNVTLLIITN